jgi:hypothetical protein
MGLRKQQSTKRVVHDAIRCNIDSALVRLGLVVKKHRRQVRQVDIAELSGLLTVLEAMYSLYGFLANNDDHPTSL